MAGNSAKKRTRCPNGTRKNLKTGKCEANTSRKANNAKANNAKANNAKANKVYKYRVKAKPSAKSRKQKKTMQNQFMLLSKTYQAHKAEQTVKRGLAKKIMANNLQRTKLSLKKKN